MNQENKSLLASFIKEARQRKGYTQQELSEVAGISIRSVQRIENGEVVPRGYTLRVLAEHLDLKDVMNRNGKPGSGLEVNLAEPAPTPVVGRPAVVRLNTSRKIILTAGIGIFLLLGGLAFISQSPHFPETDFEGFCFWAVVTVIYTVTLFKLWR